MPNYRLSVSADSMKGDIIGWMLLAIPPLLLVLGLLENANIRHERRQEEDND
jgi:hypothetical protein